ncbi:histidine kinase [uncultured Psychroserpens sp.]|uniref:histidine kinase n=1 Tax=uncultured Psychroserpens sp. TaxID=255436 RepID=UPI00260465EA|nr:histidine kinase [uncultured Psychroserpens sp.]
MVKITKNSERYPETTDTKFSDVLMYFSESLLGIDDEEEILWDLAKNCISKLGFVDCVVYLLDDIRNVMVQKAAYGPKNPKDFEIYEPVERPVGTGIVGYVAQTGIAELLHDTSKDERYKMDDEFRLSEVCVPIIIDGKVIGIIDCEHPDKHFFSEHHLHMLLTISSICAIKIKGVRAQKKYIQQQERSIEIQTQLVDLKLKALSAQMNPHFVFNALNAIQYFVSSGNKKLALEYLSIFSKLIRFYLKNFENDTVSFKDEMSMLNWYLKLQKLRYDQQFEFKIEEIKRPYYAVIPSFIIQTLFENIIEHAVYNQHKNQVLFVHFEVTDTNVTLNIKYRHDTLKKDSNYKPEYRDNIISWQDQIRLLNKVKDYNIEKHITFVNNDTQQGGDITLILPNLS